MGKQTCPRSSRRSSELGDFIESSCLTMAKAPNPSLLVYRRPILGRNLIFSGLSLPGGSHLENCSF